MAKNGEPETVPPDDDNGFSVWTRVHESGGGSFAVSNGVVFFSNNADQRLYRRDSGSRGQLRHRRPPRRVNAYLVEYEGKFLLDLKFRIFSLRQ
jgi:hypothetical protein